MLQQTLWAPDFATLNFTVTPLTKRDEIAQLICRLKVAVPFAIRFDVMSVNLPSAWLSSATANLARITVALECQAALLSPIGATISHRTAAIIWIAHAAFGETHRLGFARYRAETAFSFGDKETGHNVMPSAHLTHDGNAGSPSVKGNATLARAEPALSGFWHRKGQAALLANHRFAVRGSRARLMDAGTVASTVFSAFVETVLCGGEGDATSRTGHSPITFLRKTFSRAVKAITMLWIVEDGSTRWTDSHGRFSLLALLTKGEQAVRLAFRPGSYSDLAHFGIIPQNGTEIE